MPPGANSPPVFRLFDMRVEEVSLVDRAANGRKRFLVIKSEGEGAVLSPNGDGTYRVSPAEKAEGEGTPPPGAQAPPPPVAPEGPVAGPAKLTADMRTVLSAVLASAAKTLGDVTAMVEGAEVVADEATADVSPLVDPLMVAVESLEDVLSAMYVEEEEMTATEPSPPADSAPEPGVSQGCDTKNAPPPNPRRPSYKERHGFFAAKRTIARYETPTLLAKIGAKMSTDRLRRFEILLRGLSQIFEEVRPGFLASQAQAASQPAPSTSKQPTAKRLATPTQGLSHPSPSTPQELLAVRAELSKTAATVAEQAKVISWQQDRIRSFERPPTRNGLSADGGGEPRLHAWPPDLNTSHP